MINQLTCEETFRQLDDFIDRELSEEDCRLVQKHLDICAICSKEFNFEAGVWKEVRTKLKRTVVPTALREKLSLFLKETECFEPDEN